MKDHPQFVPVDQRRFTRRRVIQFATFLASKVAVAACAKPETPPTPVVEQINPKIFSGDPEQTIGYLNEWNERLNSHPNELEAHFSNIANLAIAYFSKQMEDKFPQRRKSYDRSLFSGVSFFVDEKTFIQKQVETCAIPAKSVRVVVQAKQNKLYLNKQDPDLKRPPATTAFALLLYGLHAIAAPFVEHPIPERIYGIPLPVVYERGLVAFGKDPVNKDCVVGYREQLDAVVIEDSNQKLLARLGLNMSNSDFGAYL